MVDSFANLKRRQEAGEIEVLSLVCTPGRDDYIFAYDGSNRLKLLERIARMAADPDLDLNWHEAGEISLAMVSLHKLRLEQQR